MPMSTAAPLPEPRLSPFEPRCVTCTFEKRWPRTAISPKNETTPAISTATIISRTSPLRIWVSSCAMTASSSASSSVSISPRVTVTVYCFSLTPEAKALSASVSMMARRGTAMPREMQRSSVSFHKRGDSSRVSGAEPVAQLIIATLAEKPITTQRPVMMSAMGV